MAFGGGSGGGVRSDINITPLVDVVLVLLIIFMVMTPTLLKEVDVKVPPSNEQVDVNTQPATPNEEIVVSVKPNGRVQLNHEPIEESRLGDRVRDAIANRSEKRVYLEIDDEAIYGDAMHVMDICRGAGVKTLGLMPK